MVEIPIPEFILQHFEKVFIDEVSVDSPVAQRVLRYFPQYKVEIVGTAPSAEFKKLQNTSGNLSPQQIDRSKKLLHITPFKGQFFKRCPGATQKRTLTCCNYHVLNLGAQCNFDCSYCYLQSYLNHPLMKIYSNIDQALQELREMAEQFPQHPFRVGTGEVIDSLSLDPLTLYSRELIPFFAQYPNWTLELKTKSAHVDQFLDLPHANNIMVAWSINPPNIINAEEHGTARFAERINAAKKCATRGHILSFHIDPMIYHEGWQENYSYLVDQIAEHFTPEQVQVMSVGSLRFQPEQRHTMRARFGMQSHVMQAEMFQSDGGKMRYDSALRTQMFEHVVKRFKNHSSQWKIFMCMETPESWISLFDKTPMQVDELKPFFRPLPKIRNADLALPESNSN